MSKFSDASGLAWQFEFDCFLLDRVDKEAKVDLADMSAAGLLAVERDVKALGRVLVVVCGDELTKRGKSPAEFIKQIRKDAITRARKAVMESLADFFPESEWSEMQSSLAKKKEQTDQMSTLEALAPAFDVLPEDVKSQLFREEIERVGNSPSSTGNESAPDQDTTPPSPVDDSPENAESAPEDLPSETSG